MKAALGVLLSRLRSAAVDGAVPESAFVEQVQALGLGGAERERLRDELARLGLPVREAQVHSDADTPDMEKVAPFRGENVFAGADVVQTLLLRYADADGFVTSRVVHGVARLAGLGERDTAVLRDGARVRDVEAVPDASAASGEPGAGGGDDPASDGEPEHAAVGGDSDAAVAAAMAVLREDRFRRHLGNSLLTAEAEVGLAVLLRGGTDSVGQEPEDEELSGLPSDDIRVRARDCLVLHNQRLVHSLIRSCLDQGLEYEDLVQHGVLGLMRAARKFDPAKGYKFSTYATWWVRQSVSRAIADEGALIRVPVHMHEQMRKVAAAERALAAQGRPAGNVDVAVQCDMTLDRVEEIRKLTRRTDSLDRIIGDGATLGDFVGKRQALPSVENDVLHVLLMEDVMGVVGTFSERSARILVRRLGLDGEEPSTLDELGREFGVTRERIRQLEGKARSEFRCRLRAAGLLSGHGPQDEEEDAGKQIPPRRARARASATVAPVGGMDAGRVVLEEPLPEVVPKPKPEPPTEPARPEPAEESSTRTDEEAAPAKEPGQYTGENAFDGAPDEPPPAPTALGGQQVQHTADWGKAQRMSAEFAGGIAEGRPGRPDAADEEPKSSPAEDERYVASVHGPPEQMHSSGRDDGEQWATPPGQDAEHHRTPSVAVAAQPAFPTGESAAEWQPGPPRGEPDQHQGSVRVGVESDQSPAQARELLLGPVREETQQQSTAGAEDLGRQLARVRAEAQAEADARLARHTAMAEARFDRLRAESERFLEAERREHEARLARVHREHEVQLAAERQAADARVAAAEADTERQLETLEEALLYRVDIALSRQERYLKGQAEERLARLREGHREAQRIIAERADRALEAARSAAQGSPRDEQQLTMARLRATQAEQRAVEAERRAVTAVQRASRAEQQVFEGDQRLRRQREEADAHIENIEERLGRVEAQLIERDHAIVAGRQQAQAQVEEAEQRAAQHTAQTEHDAWARISELQEELAAVRGDDDGRTSFRGIWHRS
ncbi:sigma-70 family RNA polymerase sigma factor [Streptomyces scabiei]|uniref:sigma-70 family RNA polymerase sigma factor n=1 Tax=Streptomyces scabiei TaxID=1930 RepID=UPI0006770CCF|nr:sigma-70 family RNA polymerase sigma factor [Streptomyces scabiei]MDX2532532.1 sigma-70 family RNA polymerase sigma factor [Streptomyces scabiei]MDX2579434.1 sigma-70 family RNA polymerase sigma factor [Streptomyces scabiei]MDX2658228.1 sigma-70 family RNA polymerase sigma factor [Streptomyces scabiei]MDX2794836.1 sigma-70 family RNA polymerase sigma factor [Streptomyces scabiei]MDX2832145.1 sigma-70 family RNA polymerase sigma factor [Streptomyces scabiei]